MRKNKVLTVVCILIAMLQLTTVITFANSSGNESSASDVPFIPTYVDGTFGAFLEDYARAAIPDETVYFDLTNPSAGENYSYGTVDGKDNVLITQEDGYVEFTVNVPATGLYSLGVDYYPIKGKGSAIERNIYINGWLQYVEARAATLDRIYKDNVEDLRDFDSFFTRDAYGNETRREQVENPYWIYGAAFEDASASYDYPLKFYLEKGTNVITIESLREPVAFSAIYLYGDKEPISFGEFMLDNLIYQTGGDQLIGKYQAEYPYGKNDPTLFASYDRASAATEPASVDTIKLNTMGGNSSGAPRWSVSGQWIEYKVDVPAAGLYKIIFRARQNTLNGSFVSREITVNGKVQFEEASRIKIGFSDDWQIVTPTDEYNQPLLFYFEEGENTVRFEAVYGDMADIINAVGAVITNLNVDSQKILMVTGPSPDKYRDYEFDEIIPEVISDLKAQADILRKIHDELLNILGENGQYTALVRNIYNTLLTLYEDPDSIASEYSAFKNCITNLGSWLLDIRSLPLEIDYFIIAEENYEAPAAEAGMFDSLWFNVKMFFSSFFTDFNSISSSNGEAYTETATVWTMSARDQAQVLRQLIDRSFIPEKEINLSMSLVPSGALLPSILAGKGPDVVLGISTEEVINYSTRNALEPLDGYEGFDEMVSERFIKNATESMSAEVYDENGNIVKHTYGMPETMKFQVLFYRSDIMNSLGLKVPNTWDEVYEVIPVMQKRYMEYAPPEYNTLLYQAGGSLYKYRGQASDIDSPVAIDAFIRHTELYTNYGLSIEFDFENRFRQGSMPIGDTDLYAFYNKMSIFAPEIKGLWSFTTVPGTIREDGSIDKSNIATFTCTVLLQTAKEKDNGWKFIDWWTSDEIQTDFGREIESVLGAAGRYNSANINAVLAMNWTASEVDAIEEQFASLIPYPEVIAGYYTTRYVGFAFTSVVVDYDDPREAVLNNVMYINEEIIHKRTELGLPLDMIDID